MNAILTRFQPYISLKPFLLGLGVVGLIYLGLFGFIISQSDKTLLRLEENLASQAIAVERPEQLAPVIMHHGSGQSTHGGAAAGHHRGVALLPAPLDGLYEDNGHGGLLPIISEYHLSPFKAYKKEFFSDSKPMIAVVVTDFGLSDLASDMVLQALPSEVSLLLSPYGADADDWQKRARAAGHEVWLHIPMESLNMPAEDPGPQALLSRESLKYNQERIDWLLTRTTGYAGVAAYSDDSFSGTGQIIPNIFKELFARGVGYMELNPDAPPLLETLTLSSKTPYARNQVFVETTSLKAIEKMATKYGYVVAVIRPYSNAIESIKTWMDTLPQKGFIVAPVSAVAELNNE